MSRFVPPADSVDATKQPVSVPSVSTADSGQSSAPAKRDPRQNLRSWKPGQSGNPHGRPIGVVRLIREQTDDFRVLVRRLLEIVEHGRDRDAIAAIQELFDRGGVSRKPLQLEISGPDGGPIQTSSQAWDVTRLSAEQTLRLREILLAMRRPAIEGTVREVTDEAE